MTLRRRGLLLLPLLLAVPSLAQAADPRDQRWGVGLELAGLAQPGGHLGLGASEGHGVTGMVVGRYRLLSFAALDAGFGLPHPGLGVGGWASWEMFAPLVSDREGTLALSVFEESGLQLGYAGPDYYARHGGDFVGYSYAAAGPMAFALRFSAGLDLRWAGGRVDSYVEAVPIVALTPSAELLYDLTFGTRIRF